MATQGKRQDPFRAATIGNVAYDLDPRGNVVHVPQRELELELEPERRRVSQQELRQADQTRTRAVPLRKQQGISLLAVAGFCLVALLAVGVLTSYIQLNGIYADTMAAQTELTELESTYDKLAAEDEEIFDSATLNQAAEEAGLSKADSAQKVYLELSDPDSTVVYQQQKQATGLQGCWEAVKSFFGGLGAYFN